MANSRQGSFQKSLYLFLSSLLGVLLFLLVHQAITFVVLVVMLLKDSGGTGEFYLLFSVFSYFTLIIALMLGSWYGIWLGMYWYQKVYEEGSYEGFVSRIQNHLWQGSPQTAKFEDKLKTTQQTFQEGMKEFRELAGEWPPEILSGNPARAAVVKKSAARKRAVKKVK